MIPGCNLDQRELRDQRARYARNAPHRTRLDREPDALVVEFDEHYDLGALHAALAVERECCPFFQIDFDTARRRLRITVADAEQVPALDALARAFGGAGTISPAARV